MRMCFFFFFSVMLYLMVLWRCLHSLDSVVNVPQQLGSIWSSARSRANTRMECCSQQHGQSNFAVIVWQLDLQFSFNDFSLGDLPALAA
mmetsp:Transcript_3612/g.6987  ORF Transcript_3612/g.6987 Transcript_3612/m.6987 type:complete len:89 (+) Transcript_3612:934-1200(+)